MYGQPVGHRSARNLLHKPSDHQHRRCTNIQPAPVRGRRYRHPDLAPHNPPFRARLTPQSGALSHAAVSDSTGGEPRNLTIELGFASPRDATSFLAVRALRLQAFCSTSHCIFPRRVFEQRGRSAAQLNRRRLRKGSLPTVTSLPHRAHPSGRSRTVARLAVISPRQLIKQFQIISTETRSFRGRAYAWQHRAVKAPSRHLRCLGPLKSRHTCCVFSGRQTTAGQALLVKGPSALRSWRNGVRVQSAGCPDSFSTQ